MERLTNAGWRNTVLDYSRRPCSGYWYASGPDHGALRDRRRQIIVVAGARNIKQGEIGKISANISESNAVTAFESAPITPFHRLPHDENAK